MSEHVLLEGVDGVEGHVATIHQALVWALLRGEKDLGGRGSSLMPDPFQYSHSGLHEGEGVTPCLSWPGMGREATDRATSVVYKITMVELASYVLVSSNPS